jgi:ABC-type nitrate/sulfonate/bicarbonate transport system permease component
MPHPIDTPSATRGSSRTRRTLREATDRIAPPVVLIAALILVWEVWVRWADIDPSVVAPPSRVARALAATSGPLTGHAATTLAETVIGLAIGALIGVIVALAIDHSRGVRRALEPLLVVLQTIPPIVLAPVLVLALGFGWAPRIVVVVLIVFFPVAIAAAGAFRATDPERIDVIRSLGGSRRDVLRHITLPGALPAIFDGIRISAAYSVAGAAIAEQIGGARSGLGLYISRSQRSFRADQVIAGVVVIAALSLLIYALIGLAARRALPWQTAARLERA